MGKHRRDWAKFLRGQDSDGDRSYSFCRPSVPYSPQGPSCEPVPASARLTIAGSCQAVAHINQPAPRSALLLCASAVPTPDLLSPFCPPVPVVNSETGWPMPTVRHHLSYTKALSYLR